MPSHHRVGILAQNLTTFIGIYLLENQIGYTTGETNAYWIGKQRYIPDIAVVLHATRERLHANDINAAPYDYYPPDIAYDPYPPDLAIEVISVDSARERRDLAVKTQHYLQAGVVVWIVDRFQLQITVYLVNGHITTLGVGDTLKGEPILPNFRLALDNLFEYYL